ncbi:THAP domain-containing protein 1-like [Rhipicephalus microplus]|uniref:THAP domain-containing protein 1-like n=1 Tax=Rhipicephalus microplus TaxID=6941 RepID=UPI003F6C90B0
MPACWAVNCTSRPEKSSGKTFHAFPRSQPHLYQQWVVNLKRDKWKPSPGSRLCSSHFTEACFDRSGSRTRLKSDAIPTLFSFPEHLQKKTPKRKPPKDRAPIPDLSTSDEAHRPITVSWGLDLVDYQIRAENTVGNAPRNPQATATLYHEKKKSKRSRANQTNTTNTQKPAETRASGRKSFYERGLRR